MLAPVKSAWSKPISCALGLTADDAIRDRLRTLGKSAKNWSVISSDRQVQAEAHAARAEVIPSEQFASQVINTLRAGPPRGDKKSPITETELAEWLALFSEKGTKDKSKL
jgi:hypothetical protein